MRFILWGALRLRWPLRVVSDGEKALGLCTPTLTSHGMRVVPGVDSSARDEV